MTHDRRCALLIAALGFVQFEGAHLALATLHRWLDTWTGVGLVAVGMHRQGYDLALTQYADRGWRCTFYEAGMAHSITRRTSSAFEPTPWRAVQRAA